MFNKFKEWVVRKCGGIMPPAPEKFNIITTEYPIHKLSIIKCFTDDQNMLLGYIENDVAHEFARYIFKNNLYDVYEEKEPREAGLHVYHYTLYVAAKAEGYNE